MTSKGTSFEANDKLTQLFEVKLLRQRTEGRTNGRNTCIEESTKITLILRFPWPTSCFLDLTYFTLSQIRKTCNKTCSKVVGKYSRKHWRKRGLYLDASFLFRGCFVTAQKLSTTRFRCSRRLLKTFCQKREIAQNEQFFLTSQCVQLFSLIIPSIQEKIYMFYNYFH